MNHKITKRLFCAAAASAMAVSAIWMPSVANAQDERPLEGKTINFVVGYGPGGGFDSYARMLAPHLEERTGATVVVDNRPGAGGKTATNQMMREDADGTVQYLMNGVPAVLGQITKGAGVDYDLTQLTFLARINAEAWAVMVNKDTPYRTLEDLANADKPITFAALSRADGPSDGAAVLCEALQIECKIVLGFEGTSEASLAVIRGEAEAIVMTDTTVFTNTQDDQARAVGILGDEKSILFPDLGTLPEQISLSDEGKFWNTYRGNIAGIGRTVLSPPGMDEAMTEYLRGVWDDILTDPEVVAEGEKMGRLIIYASGTEVQGMVESVFGGDASQRQDEIEDVLLNKYFN